MKNNLLALLITAILTLANSTATAQNQSVKSAVDWPQFLASHDLVWNSTPTVWHESAFIGNGLLGATIYSEGTNVLQWDVGRSDVVDRGGRIAIGRFALVPSHPITGGTMRLSLWDAEARGTLLNTNTSPNTSEVEWRSFTHATDAMTVIELTERIGSEPARFVFQHSPALPARDEFQKNPVPEDQRNPTPTFGETEGVHWCRQAFKTGGGYVVAWGERSMAPGKREFVFTVDFAPNDLGETKPARSKAVSDVQAALKADFERQVKSHRDWWHAFYPKSFLSIPDTRMESFYWIQLYKLASGTRSDRPALDLMGPWFRRTPWPKIWWNLNIQLTYWPVYAANHLELGESLTKMLDAGTPNLISNVPPQWREDSAAIARTSSYDCRGAVKGNDGEERGNLTWALHNYWLQYRFSGDETMLRDRLYPLLKRAAGYYLHLLKPGADGKLHLPISTSPEYPDKAPDTNYDLSLLRWALQTLIATNERFRFNDPLASKWRETLAQLTPFPVDPATGYMVGDGVPFTKSHRHFSHLFMIYPLHLVDPQSAADRPLIDKSLANWHSMPGALRGYSFTGGSAISAWMGRSTEAVSLLDSFLEFRQGKTTQRFPICANTMYTEAGPVIETPLAGAASLQEILLQSWSMEAFGTHIRIFPAVPAAWSDASFDKLLAEGAFEVSAVRRGGNTMFVQINSLTGSPCRVATGLEEPLVASGSRQFKLITETDRNGQRITLVALRKGETVLLTSAKAELAPGDFEVKPVPAQPDRVNFYGSPKP